MTNDGSCGYNNAILTYLYHPKKGKWCAHTTYKNGDLFLGDGLLLLLF